MSPYVDGVPQPDSLVWHVFLLSLQARRLVGIQHPSAEADPQTRKKSWTHTIPHNTPHIVL